MQIQFNPIGDRIASSFFSQKYQSNGKPDLVESEKVFFEDFARTFAVFRQVNTKGKPNSHNSKEHKVKQHEILMLKLKAVPSPICT